MNKNKANKEHFELLIIADRSGSMSHMIDEARNAMNQLIEDQKQVKGKANISICIFDNEYTSLMWRTNIKQAKNVGDEYYARGTTALYDAIGKAINKMKKDKRGSSKVLVTIVTDGLENASQEYSSESVKLLINKCKEDDWDFKFLGANIDSFAEGSKFGLLKADTMNYTPDSKGIRAAYAATSSHMTTSRTS